MAVAATPDRATALPARRHRLYLPRRARIALTIALGLSWASLSVVIDRAWIGDLAALVSLPVAIAIVAGVAIVPGYLNVQLSGERAPRPSEAPASVPARRAGRDGADRGL
jgi:biofilm PGA synthesis N-glycosyltransferase PgaC